MGSQHTELSQVMRQAQKKGSKIGFTYTSSHIHGASQKGLLGSRGHLGKGGVEQLAALLHK